MNYLKKIKAKHKLITLNIKKAECFCKKNSNTFFNEYGELHYRRNNKTLSKKIFSLSKSADSKR